MNSDLVSDFQRLTSSPPHVSQHYLEAYNWDLNLALEAYYRDQDSSPPQPAPKAAAPPTQPAQPKPASKPQSSVRTLSDFNKEQNEDEDNEKLNYYTGGEKSGQLVQAPKVPIKVEDIFEKAKQHGATPLAEDGKKDNFLGSGFRLGSTLDIPSQRTESTAPLNITFWRNGFQVGDSPLRSLSDPANREFLEDVGKGIIPRELEAGKRGLSVHLVQKEEDYVPPKPQMKAFSGSGQTLGAYNTSHAPASSTSSPSKPKSLSLDQTRPITTLQIRLHDGTRLVAKFNTHHTVQDLCNFIEASQNLAGRGYQIKTTFPNKTITNREETLEEAKLLNAVIVQSLV